jgi:hypothetical protein
MKGGENGLEEDRWDLGMRVLFYFDLGSRVGLEWWASLSVFLFGFGTLYHIISYYIIS